MPVKKIFWDDPYCTQLNAKITHVDSDIVCLDRTIFYAQSGGQDSDKGTIGGHEVRLARKDSLEIYYTLADGHGLRKGDDVAVLIDWDRRYRLMRLHFAAEIVLELIYQHFNRPLKIGANIHQDKARLDFAWDGTIADAFPLVQEVAGRLIHADLPIKSEFSDRAREKRYWEIEGFAQVACGGTHIRKTGEVGGIALKRKNIGKSKERIEISLKD